MKTPFAAAALGLAAAYYVCAGADPRPAVSAAGFPAVSLIAAGFACVLASAAISCAWFAPARRGRCLMPSALKAAGPGPAGFPLYFLALCAAAGVFAGVLVHEHQRLTENSAYYGFAAEKLTRFEGHVQSDSRISKNGNILAPLRIVRVWDPAGNSAGASADVIALFSPDSRRLGAGTSGTGKSFAAEEVRFFQGERLRLTGSLSRPAGVSFLFAREAVPESVSPLFALRKKFLLKIEARIASFQTGPPLAEAAGKSPRPARRSRTAWPGLFTALLLGNQENLDTELAEGFRRAGVVHVLALSGMHLGLLALLARLCLRPFIRGRMGDAITLLLVLAYLWLAGPRPSLLRAAIMFAGYTILYSLDRRPGLLSLLFFSFIASAVFSPQDLRSLSFILSYLAMLGILLFSAPVNHILRRWIPRSLAAPLAVSVAAQIAVSPLMLAVFGLVAPGGIPASVGLGPLVTAFMWTGILTCALSVLPAPLSYPPAWALSFVMNGLYAAITLIVELCARIPPISL
ncbi:MAG: ComEC/Rec2 family competence protein [Spirochaetales bacterium]|jgi:ComEC/Rec2-related protein|nr:ComEC/Rec2 family competence protein [Spirochaetales bacterium]